MIVLSDSAGNEVDFPMHIHGEREENYPPFFDGRIDPIFVTNDDISSPGAIAKWWVSPRIVDPDDTTGQHLSVR